MVSRCCDAPLWRVCCSETLGYYVCDGCLRPTNAKVIESIQGKEEDDGRDSSSASR